MGRGAFLPARFVREMICISGKQAAERAALARSNSSTAFVLHRSTRILTVCCDLSKSVKGLPAHGLHHHRTAKFGQGSAWVSTRRGSGSRSAVISSQSLVGCLAVDVKLASFHWSLMFLVPPSWARFVREMFCIS